MASDNLNRRQVVFDYIVSGGVMRWME